MNQSKQHKKTSESDKDQAPNKGQNQQVSDSAVDLPGAVQRVANDSTRRSGDILALQKTIGNRTVRRLVQRSGDVVQRTFTDDPEYQEWRTRMVGALGPMTSSLNDLHTRHGSEGEALDNTLTATNSSARIWNEASIQGGSGGGTPAPAEGSATEESETSETAGGG